MSESIKRSASPQAGEGAAKRVRIEEPASEPAGAAAPKAEPAPEPAAPAAPKTEPATAESSAASETKPARDPRPNRNTGGNLDTARAGGTGRAETEDGETGARLPKRKVAVLFGYCGIGYSGLQINPGVKTIEGDIFDAFCTAGAVSKENAVNPVKVGLQRAARTDRGVHAAGNLLNLKLILDPPGIPPGTLVEHINTKLPPFIRIWGLTRVQNSFNARTSCDSRLYEYLLPTYVLLPPKPGSAMHEMMLKWQASEEEALAKSSKSDEEKAAARASKTPLQELLEHDFWKTQGTEHTYQEDVSAKKKWRIDAAHLENLRGAFAKYQGSHNFHNFTVGKEFRDRSAQRVMKRLEISDAKEINGTEWVSITFHGQSFMLHQIRKMIGLLVLVGRLGAPASLIPELYGPARVHVPKAPGLGLLLEEPFFHGYNRKLEDARARPGGGQGEDREFVEYSAFKGQMDEFKQTFIYDRIMQTEEETAEFAKWLNYLDVFQGPDFEYLNPRGVIPTAAILKVGEERRAPGGQPKGSRLFGDDDDEDAEALKGGNLADLEG